MRQGDLDFQRDDEILILERLNGDWWIGKRIADGTVGSLPSSFVKPLSANINFAAVLCWCPSN